MKIRRAVGNTSNRETPDQTGRVGISDSTAFMLHEVNLPFFF